MFIHDFRRNRASADIEELDAFCKAELRKSEAPVLGPPSAFKFSEPPKRLDGNGNEIRGSKP